MIATLLTILLLTVAAIVLVAAIVILSPLGCIAEFSVSGKERWSSIAVYWLHPRLLWLAIDIEHQVSTLHILKWSRGLERTERQNESEKPEKLKQSDKSDRSNWSDRSDRSDKSDRSNWSDRSDRSDRLDKSNKSDGFFHRWGQLFCKVKKILSILLDRRLVGPTLRWLGRDISLLLHLVRLHHVRIAAKAGADDPVETGKFYGYYIALRSAIVSRRSRVDIRVEPYFGGELLEVEGSIGVTFSIARLLLAGMIALATFPWFPVYCAWRKLKKVRTEAVHAAEGVNA